MMERLRVQSAEERDGAGYLEGTTCQGYANLTPEHGTRSDFFATKKIQLSIHPNTSHVQPFQLPDTTGVELRSGGGSPVCRLGKGLGRDVDAVPSRPRKLQMSKTTWNWWSDLRK
jgi:hypothetical protein